MKLIDITGHRYSRLIVIRMAGRKKGRPLWRCLCDCGNEITALSNSLRQGNTKSCGCWHSETSSKNGKSNRTHGESKSREYRTWVSMRERCNNPRNKDFASYGGRGITVCLRWISFENFLLDMGRCPPGHSIDRKDNNDGYNPKNCHWATSSEQNKNRRAMKRARDGKFVN